MIQGRVSGARGASRPFLILCPDYDVAALWVYEELSKTVDCALIRSSDLDLATRWDHRLGDRDSVEIELEDGRVICGSGFRGVLNRTTAIPACLAPYAVESDRDYAMGEAAAFAMSWLACLPNVLNRPTPLGMSGAWRHMSDWAILAGAAGLNVPDYQQDQDDWSDKGQRALVPEHSRRVSLVSFGSRIYGAPLPAKVERACLRLHQLAGIDFLGVELAYEDGSDELIFSYATPWPDLRIGGNELVADLAAYIDELPL